MPVWVNPVSVLTGEYCCILARRRAFTFPETPLGSSSTDSIWSLIFQLASLPPLGFLCLNSLLDIVPRQNVVTGTIQCLSSKSHRSHLWFPYYVFCFFPHTDTMVKVVQNDKCFISISGICYLTQGENPDSAFNFHPSGFALGMSAFWSPLCWCSTSHFNNEEVIPQTDIWKQYSVS